MKKLTAKVQNLTLPLWEKVFKSQEDPVKEQLNLMSKISLFNNIPYRSLKLIRARCHIRYYKKDEHIFREGEPGIGMYIIIEGKVEIFKEKENIKTILSTLEKGDFFGEIALLLPDKPRSATAKALEPTTLLGFFNPDLQILMKRNPHVSTIFLYNIANIISERLIKTNELLEKGIKP
jgi:CRP-like cAMP-binding protein